MRMSIEGYWPRSCEKISRWRKKDTPGGTYGAGHWQRRCEKGSPEEEKGGQREPKGDQIVYKNRRVEEIAKKVLKTGVHWVAPDEFGNPFL